VHFRLEIETCYVFNLFMTIILHLQLSFIPFISNAYNHICVSVCDALTLESLDLALHVHLQHV